MQLDSLFPLFKLVNFYMRQKLFASSLVVQASTAVESAHKV